ncbi:MAG: bifunctional DNA-formamidopyrimidine glycosylase/DNA-(apurinic or apyrimidinic site) lyase [Myxococcales bacterium]|nr:bifunctional DNA-formamidopyrimidine glycosylase/DNA-(apurinic or apyrimidinic site) lyase [Myxococcales bacterium]
MPELPEVETVRAWLAPSLIGATLQRVQLQRPDLRYPIPVDAVHHQVGRAIGAVRRRAKYLLIDLVDPSKAETERDGDVSSLLIHLGMSGRCWLDVTPTPDPPWRKHEHWRMWFSHADGTALLRYQDARRFGALDVVRDPASHKLLTKLGYEPFDPAFSGAWLYEATRGRKVAIKSWLMDSRRVVGVGNIYASEACWRAQVDPFKSAGKVGRKACDRLVIAVVDVLQEAIAAGGSTLKDFVGGDENPGYFQQRLDVYGREGQPCHRCEDAEIVVARRVLLGRATFLCPRCQR